MSLRVVICCLLAGLVMTMAGAGAGSPGWWYLSGIVVVAAFVPFLVKGPLEHWKRFFGIWSALTAVSVLCLWSEAYIFVPVFRQQSKTMLFGSLFMNTLLAGAITLCAGLLKLRMAERPAPVALRSLGVIAIGVLGAGLCYVLYYYIFGAIAFQFFTKPYYTGTGMLGDAEKAASALGWWFPAIQLARGTLMSLGVLPIILGTRLPRLRLAIYVGLLVWAIGGLAPLIPPSALMPLQLRIMHVVEIFAQNFCLGATAVLLLRPDLYPR